MDRIYYNNRQHVSVQDMNTMLDLISDKIKAVTRVLDPTTDEKILTTTTETCSGLNIGFIPSVFSPVTEIPELQTSFSTSILRTHMPIGAVASIWLASDPGHIGTNYWAVPGTITNVFDSSGGYGQVNLSTGINFPTENTEVVINYTTPIGYARNVLGVGRGQSYVSQEATTFDSTRFVTLTPPPAGTVGGVTRIYLVCVKYSEVLSDLRVLDFIGANKNFFQERVYTKLLDGAEILLVDSGVSASPTIPTQPDDTLLICEVHMCRQTGASYQLDVVPRSGIGIADDHGYVVDTRKV